MTAVEEAVAADAVAHDRIDPQRSAAVLIGVHTYEHLAPLPSVTRNLDSLQKVLTDGAIFGLPGDRVFPVADPQTSAELGNPIRQAARLATDTLIVYYAGHGLVDREEDQLHLTLPGSQEEHPDTCVRSGDIRRAMTVKGSKAKRRVLILDCCYSGKFVTPMSPESEGVRGGEMAKATLRAVQGGAYVMTSAPKDRPSHAPDPKRCTVFTGALVDTMRQGVVDGPPMLGLDALYNGIKGRINELPPGLRQEPQAEDRNDVGGLGFVNNAALLPRQPPPVPPRKGKTVALAAGAGVLGLAIGLSAPYGLGLWDRWNPDPATGACSSKAALLDHSDDLNKKRASAEAAEGLSALALVPGEPGKALALADNDPGRIFPVNLGTPTDLRPSPETATTLRRDKADGAPLPEWYDGEAMAVEEGGRTVLIGSENGPAIRRFDLATGHQVGVDFVIPKELSYWPDGGAQLGRSIESLTVSPDGRYLYAGWEAPLAQDGDTAGRNILRIQRYEGEPGGTYRPDKQYAYRSGDGLNLVELVAVEEGRLLALERQYVSGLGNAIQVVDLSLKETQGVKPGQSLYRLPADVFDEGRLLFNLADCPSGGPGAVKEQQSWQINPLLTNVEGMALGGKIPDGTYKGWRSLYLISDDNRSAEQITRVYSLAVDLS